MSTSLLIFCLLALASLGLGAGRHACKKQLHLREAAFAPALLWRVRRAMDVIAGAGSFSALADRRAPCR